jgi:hypothetical protein
MEYEIVTEKVLLVLEPMLQTAKQLQHMRLAKQLQYTRLAKQLQHTRLSWNVKFENYRPRKRRQ